MEKLKCVIQAPFDFYSNLGDKSRQFIKNLISIRSDWDIKLIYTTDDRFRGNYLNDNNDTIITRLPKIEKIDNPNDIDMFIQFAPGNLLKRSAKINIGVVLTEDLSNSDSYPQWIDSCNKMDYIITYSAYSRETLTDLEFNKIKIKTPVNVLREYSDIIDIIPSDNDLLKGVQTNWNFLIDCYWSPFIPEELGSVNKYNVSVILKNFFNNFKDIDNAPGLVLHVGGNKKSNADRDNILNKIYTIRESIKYTKSLPMVYLVYGDLNENEIKRLYSDNRIKSFINTPQREDTIGKLLNFMSTGKPIIYSNWASPKEILNYEGNYPINGELKRFGSCGPKLIDIFLNDLNMAMYNVFYHYSDYENLSKVNSKILLDKLSLSNYIHSQDQIMKFGGGK